MDIIEIRAEILKLLCTLPDDQRMRVAQDVIKDIEAIMSLKEIIQNMRICQPAHQNLIEYMRRDV